jgi:class 3 adenylate cyclase/tetratricopeptide (TPR) repeat protein
MSKAGVREILTLVFTDMVASTAFRQSHGASVADEVQRLVDEIHTDLATICHGNIVKHLGDGMMITFRSAADAMQFSGGLHSELARLSSERDQAIRFRVGVSAGEVTQKDGDFFGMAPIEAARLCALAAPTDVLVSDVVARLLRGLDDIELIEPAPYDCKGIDELVVAWRLRWDMPEDTTPLPSELQGDRRFGFVGRSVELDTLRAAWADASDGGVRMVVVSGAAGLGKTHLTSTFANEAHGDGALVLYGRHDEDYAVPYQAAATALRQFVAAQSPVTLSRRLGRGRGELVRLVPELAELIGDLPPPTRGEPELERTALFDAVTEWLSRTAVTRPVVLIIDDAHWSGAPTMQLLRHLIATDRSLRLLIVATSRLPITAPPLNMLAGHGPTSDVQTIELQPFDRSTTVAFLQRAAGQELGEVATTIADYLISQTGGNPLYAREIVLHLVESGAVRQVDGRWGIATELDALVVPSSVHHLVGERVTRLPDTSQRALTWASVIGLQVELGLLAAVTDTDPDDVLDELEPCVQAGLLREEGVDRFAFSHALVRDSLYESMSPSRRVRAHRKVAAAISEMNDASRKRLLSMLAHHTDEGRDDDLTAAIHYRRLAGEQALEQLSTTVAATHFERAVDLFDQPNAPQLEPTERVRVRIELGSLLLASGSPHFEATMQRAVEEATQQRNGELLGEALLQLAPFNALRTGAVVTDRLAQLEQCLDWMASGDTALRARLLAATAVELHFTGDIERIQRLADEALAMARRVGDQAAINDVLVARLTALRFPSLVGVRRSDAIELRHVCIDRGEPAAAFMASYRLFDVEIELGDGEAMQRAAVATEALYEQAPSPFLELLLGRVQTEVAWVAGDLVAARRLLEDNWERSLASGHSTARQAARASIGMKIYAALGQHDTAYELWEPLMVPEYAALSGSGLGPAVVLYDAGRHDAAEELYRRAADDRFESIGVNTSMLNLLAFAATLCMPFGSATDAEHIAERLMPFEQYIAHVGGAAGSVQHFLGLLDAVRGDLELALARFDAASLQHARLGAPVLEGYNQVARAAVLRWRDGSDSTDAQAACRQVADIVDRTAAIGLGQRLDAWLTLPRRVS